ncbi:Reticulon-4-interacting protein 1, mitochondrial [Cladorrhinum sp. PSN332]|nr:Reticulon-4-interacting protein 1, mitochondrial [Cladorrhinum sp. PSN332]
MALPTTMKTLLQPSPQSTSLISTTSPLPTPTHPDDVLVRVHATCPCAGELLWAKNFPDAVPASKVLVPCQDLAGTVVSAPPNSAFAQGDRVYCRISAERAGAAREYALARTSELAKIPETLNWIGAAATPLSALTAWQSLFVHGALNPNAVIGDEEAKKQNKGKRVLVTGAAGGVGSWLVQLAALAGAGAVVAVCGPDKIEAVKELGATEVVNYRETTVGEWVAADPAGREVDLVVDVVGGKTLAGCWEVVKGGGVLISVNTPPDVVKPAGLENKKLAKSEFFVVEPLGSNLAEIGELIGAGRVRPTVDSVWEFDEFEKAFERLESGHAKGKIVIKVSDEA